MADKVVITPRMRMKAEEIKSSIPPRELCLADLEGVAGGVGTKQGRVIVIAGYELRTVQDVDYFVFSYVKALEANLGPATVSAMLFDWFPDTYMIEEYQANGLGGLHTFFCQRLFE